MQDLQLMPVFEAWAAEHGATDSLRPSERATRYGNFLQSLRVVVETNLDRSSPIWLRPGPFADLSLEEFVRAYLPKSAPSLDSKTSVQQQAASAAAAAAPLGASSSRKLQADVPLPAGQGLLRLGRHRKRDKRVPRSVDWVAAGAVTSIKYQGRCGSCWAWTTAATLESALLVERKRRGRGPAGDSSAGTSPFPASDSETEPSLSVQQIVSCVNSELGYTSAGCGGGFPEQAFDYIHRFNISEEHFYAPYSLVNSTETPPCNHSLLAATARKQVYRIRGGPGAAQVPPNSASELMRVVARQPVAMYYHVPIDSRETALKFRHYAGGVWPAAMCPAPDLPNWHDLCNHNMMIAGYSQGSHVGANDSYFLIKNSWGEKWGDGGYLRSQMTDDPDGPCGMYRLNYVPLEVVRPKNRPHYAGQP
ncbi:hypothetical protein N2152v2_007335 [Parachlorella kessleri]